MHTQNQSLKLKIKKKFLTRSENDSLWSSERSLDKINNKIIGFSLDDDVVKKTWFKKMILRVADQN